MRLVYTATQQPVRIGDPVTIDGQPCYVDSFRQPHKPDSEGKVTVRDALTPQGSGNREFYMGVIGAHWIEREDRGWTDEPERYNVPGHICPNTGRLAMTIAEGYKRTDTADRDFFTFHIPAAAHGLDPWRLLDGIDPSTDLDADGMPLIYALDFANGKSLDVFPDHIIYMQRTNAERQEGI